MRLRATNVEAKGRFTSTGELKSNTPKATPPPTPSANGELKICKVELERIGSTSTPVKTPAKRKPKPKSASNTPQMKPSKGKGRKRKSRRPWDGDEDDPAKPDFFSGSDRSTSDSDLAIKRRRPGSDGAGSSDASDSDEEIPQPLPVKRSVRTKIKQELAVVGLEEEADEDDGLSETLLNSPSISGSSEGEEEMEEALEACPSPLPQEDVPFCPWVEEEQSYPSLNLPPSSADLLLEPTLLMQALEVYEICRRFYQCIQLTPFLFEDLCVSLTSRAQTCLLSEIHMSLMRLLLREDESNEVIFGWLDIRDSINLNFQLMDAMTYAEVLRQYVESDKERFPEEVLAVLSQDYPYVHARQRLIVLRWLTSRFLRTKVYRDELKADGELVHDEHCRDCGKHGELLCCDSCSAAYHLQCTEPPLKQIPPPSELWFCCVCKHHQIMGVYDCVSKEELQRRSTRQASIGVDRHARRYWFLVRRLIVQDETTGQSWYYTTPLQMRKLIANLDETKLEKDLCLKLNELLPLIFDQMLITESLYFTNRIEKYRTYLEVVNDDLKSRIEASQPIYLSTSLNIGEGADLVSKTYDLLKKMDELLVHKGYCDASWIKPPVAIETGLQLTTDFDELGNFMADETLSDGESKSVNKLDDSMESNDCAPILEKMAVKEPVVVQPTSSAPPPSLAKKDIMGAPITPIDRKMIFKLGIDYRASKRKYVNWFSSNDYAKTPYLRAQERDRVKYLSHKFSLQDEGHFEWCSTNRTKQSTDIFGPYKEILKIMRETMFSMEDKLPVELMHRMWKGDGAQDDFSTWLSSAADFATIKDSLALFEGGIKKCALIPSYTSSLGHTKLLRQTMEDMEIRRTVDKKKKERAREMMIADPEEENPGIIWVRYTKLGGPPKHQLWKQKDEYYRVNGKGELGGWIWMSRVRQANFKLPSCGPEKLARTAKIDALGESLMKRRQLEERRIENEKKLHLQKDLCYSPSCISGKAFIPVAGPHSIMQACYNPACRQRLESCVISTGDTVGIKSIVQDKEDLGGDIPYPFPDPDNFKSANGTRSLFVLPPPILKCLARQGGIRDSNILGFSSTHRANYMWPYPANRPLFQTCWKYMCQSARSLHAVALCLKILWSNIRWVDMEEDNDGLRVYTEDKGTYNQGRVLKKHKDQPPFGLSSSYFVLIIKQPKEEDDEDFWLTPRGGKGKGQSKGKGRGGKQSQAGFDRSVTFSSIKGKENSVDGKPDTRSSGRLRDRKSLTKKILEDEMEAEESEVITEVQRSSKWMEESQLKLWEIMEYWRKKNGPKATEPHEKLFEEKEHVPPPTASIDKTAQWIRSQNFSQPPTPAKEKSSPPKWIQSRNLGLDTNPYHGSPQDAGYPIYASETVGKRKTTSLSRPQTPVVVLSKGRPAGKTPRRECFPGSPMPKLAPSRSFVNVDVDDFDEDEAPPPKLQVNRTNQGKPIYVTGPNNQKLLITSASKSNHMIAVRRVINGKVVLQMLNPSERPGSINGPPKLDIAESTGRPEQGPPGFEVYDPSKKRMLIYPEDQSDQGSLPRSTPRPQNLGKHSVKRQTIGLPVQRPKFAHGNIPAREIVMPDYSYQDQQGLAYQDQDIDEDEDLDEFIRDLEMSAVEPRITPKFGLPTRKYPKFREDVQREKIVNKVIKEMLNSVCALDFQWRKEKMREQREREKKDRARAYRMEKAFKQQMEQLCQQHCMYIRKEISKRRGILESTARQELEESLDAKRIRKEARRKRRRSKWRSAEATAQYISPSPQPPQPKKTKKQTSVQADLEAYKMELQRNINQKKKMTLQQGKTKGSGAKIKHTEPKRSPVKREKTPTEDNLHCICKTPYDPTKFYVGCDLCARWFHGRCVGVNEKHARKMDAWVCGECEQERNYSEQELYCVCRQPYDDTQFYVGCDGCEGWFHPRCVGITQQDAENMQEFVCESCQLGGNAQVAQKILDSTDYNRLWKVWSNLYEHRVSWPFREPVDVHQHPTYTQIVADPTDLKSIKERLEQLEYVRLGDFAADVGRVFDNARLFNPRDAPIHQCACILEKRFVEDMQNVKDSMAREMLHLGDNQLYNPESRVSGGQEMVQEEPVLTHQHLAQVEAFNQSHQIVYEGEPLEEQEVVVDEGAVIVVNDPEQLQALMQAHPHLQFASTDQHGSIYLEGPMSQGQHIITQHQSINGASEIVQENVEEIQLKVEGIEEQHTEEGVEEQRTEKVIEEQDTEGGIEERHILDEIEEQHILEEIQEQHIVEEIQEQHIVEEIQEQHIVEGVEEQHIVEEIQEQHIVEEIQEQHIVEEIQEQHIVEKIQEQHIVEEIQEQHIVEGIEEQETQEGIEEQETQEGIELQENQQGLEGHGTEEQDIEEQGTEEPGTEEGVEEHETQQGIEEQHIEEGVEEHETQQGIEEQHIEEGVEEQDTEEGIEEQDTKGGIEELDTAPVLQQQLETQENVVEHIDNEIEHIGVSSVDAPVNQDLLGEDNIDIDMIR